MKYGQILLAMLKADFLERTRRSSFLVIVCLVIYLGVAVTTGQVLIQLDGWRGIYNSAWVGSLMALVITFFLGLFGFYLVKNSIRWDEQTGVGQILATTPITRPQYLLGKWLSNFAVLSSLVGILAGAAVLMQVLSREDAQIHLFALLAPFLFIALPMMALVAGFAVFFETVSWLKGGFGNLVYFLLFNLIFVVGVQLENWPMFDVTGITLVGASMKAAVLAANPTYSGGFTLQMDTARHLQTFLWPGLNWTGTLILQRIGWLPVSLAVALLGTIFFNRFDSEAQSFLKVKRRGQAEEDCPVSAVENPDAGDVKTVRLTRLTSRGGFRFNFGRLVGLELLLLVKGLPWYWWAGMVVLWVGSIAAPSKNLRDYWFMLAGIWPVLVWSKLGEREARCRTGPLVYPTAHSLGRLLGASWIAGGLFTALILSGVLFGRIVSGEAYHLTAWLLSVAFIPTLALTLGVWSRTSKLFEVVFPILWYLGPFNTQSTLAVLDYLGVHAEAPVHVAPGGMVLAILFLLSLALAGRKQQIVT